MKEVNLDYITRMLTLRYDPKQPNPNRPLSWQSFQEHKHLTDNVSTKFIDCLLKSVLENYLMGKKSVAVGLSGGLDSSVICCYTRLVNPDIRIYAINGTFPEAEEKGDAQRIAEQCEAEFIEVDMSDPGILSDLPEWVKIIQEPRWNVYFHRIVEEASRHAKVIMTGDGGDELFGGYIFRYRKFKSLASKNVSLYPITRVKQYLECHERDWVPDQQEMFGKKVDFNWYSIYNLLTKHFENNLPPIIQLMLADYNGKLLHDFIPTTQKIIAHYNMEYFAPFLQPEISTFASHIPYSQKQMVGYSKPILRRLLRDKFVDDSLVRKSKVGFGPNLVALWNQVEGDLNHVLMGDALIIRDKLINTKWMIKGFHYCEDGVTDTDTRLRYINKMFGLLALEYWYRSL